MNYSVNFLIYLVIYKNSEFCISFIIGIQKLDVFALAGVAQWVKHWPGNQRIDCRFDSQSGHMPGLWARLLVGGMREATTH